jgi:hypothetical protein
LSVERPPATGTGTIEVVSPRTEKVIATAPDGTPILPRPVPGQGSVFAG